MATGGKKRFKKAIPKDAHIDGAGLVFNFCPHDIPAICIYCRERGVGEPVPNSAPSKHRFFRKTQQWRECGPTDFKVGAGKK